MAFRKFETIPLLFICAATILLVGLGSWQLKRLVWKEALIAQVQQVQTLPALQQVPNAAEAKKEEFRRITLAGRFIHEKELHKTSKYRGREVGYHILTPFQPYMHTGSLNDQVTILVNRGWVPASMKEREKRPETVEKEEAVISGLLVMPQKKNPFLPDNDVKHNVWLYDDANEMQHATGLTLHPMQIMLTGDPKTKRYPVPSDGKITLRNDHLGYAITWFLLALIGLVMFAVYYRKPT